MRVLITFLGAILATMVTAGPVTFAAVRNYPHIGFMFPGLENAISNPLPMPEATSFPVFEGDDLVGREDLYDAFELWYLHQCCARWRDLSGNRLILSRITRHLTFLDEDLISRERFEAEIDDTANIVNPDKTSEIDQWMMIFTGLPLKTPENLKRNAFSLDSVRFYPCSEPGTLIYAFRPRRIGNASNFDWFGVVLKTPDHLDTVELRNIFEEQFIDRLALPSRANQARGVAASMFPENNENANSIPDHPVRIDARKSVENYGDWWIAETERHIILSDIDRHAAKAFIRDLTATLPILWQAYSRLVPPLTQEQDVALIRIFRSKADYIQFVGESHAWSGAMWMPKRRELVLLQQDNPHDMMRLLRHEAFHQYLSLATGMLPTAPWINEGHACLFEHSRVEKGRVLIDEDRERADLLTDHLAAVTDFLPYILQSSYAGFYEGSDSSRRLKYAIVWGLAYYLQKGAPLEREQPYATIVTDYLTNLASSRHEAQATSMTFDALDMGAFQNAFRDFWRNNRNKAARFDPLAE